MAKKKQYKAPKTDEEEITKYKEHSKLIDKKMKEFSDMNKKWWDKDTKTWKKGFKEHGK